MVMGERSSDRQQMVLNRPRCTPDRWLSTRVRPLKDVFFLTGFMAPAIKRAVVQVLVKSLTGNPVRIGDGPAAVTPPFSA
ncbi:hypothetical protein TRIP_B220064 [uncultured Desulfatiglans sp.]|uniref:Uncharacterized protein n=1 Tax=Uncultured Desulfatiglans sp. TaxID=1748965 RepID=A0A653A426_UNCDX|nr:hypothetical protein TRIP_B220064 [uncultured Desulfatiglans sp.]